MSSHQAQQSTPPARRWGLVLALVGVGLTEVLYGCGGDAAVEQFIETHIGQTEEELLWVNTEGSYTWGDCAPNNSTVTQLNITGTELIQSAGTTDTVRATGTWAVSGASGVTMQYYMDGVLFQTDTMPSQNGANGGWSIEKAVSCTQNNVLTVCATPMTNGNATTCNDRRVCRTFTYGQGMVGIIPNSANVCPSGSSALSIYTDDEDGTNDNVNSRYGWIGATESGANTRLYFCKVCANRFKPLSTSSDYVYHYAVLKLSANCPAGSVEFGKTLDNEDYRNENSYWGDIWPNAQDENYTHLKFCMFRSGSTTMSAFPDLGVAYGVFAGANFHSNYVIPDRGGVFTDDQDGNNGNSYYPAYGTDVFWDASRIVSLDDRNTWFRMVRVK